jgi:hypothetical protein
VKIIQVDGRLSVVGLKNFEGGGMKFMNYEKIKQVCKDNEVRCPKCEYSNDENHCLVKDQNGLTPNQFMYGSKSWLYR